MPGVRVWAGRARRRIMPAPSSNRPAMPILDSRIDPRSDEFRANAEALGALVEDLKAQLARTGEGGGERAREKHLARGKLLPRERIRALLDPGAPFLELSAAGRARHVRRRRAGRRPDHRHRPRVRAGSGDRGQRRHGQGRHLFPDDGEKAPARTGSGAGEPPAVHLPGRFRRRLPAAAGRGVPGQGALRPHLLQPGAAVRAGHRRRSPW